MDRSQGHNDSETQGQPAPRLAVMLSGSGRTLQNLIKAIESGRLRATIELVIASRESIGAQRAREAGLPTIIMPERAPSGWLDRKLKGHHIEWVVLAGFLKLLVIPPDYRGRIVNIHPALLPAFGGPGMYGQRVHEAVIRSGATSSGCTVHLCDEAYDTGRILMQKTCPVEPGDTPEMLAARVFHLECEAYPEALNLLLEESRSNLSGGRIQTTKDRS